MPAVLTGNFLEYVRDKRSGHLGVHFFLWLRLGLECAAVLVLATARWDIPYPRFPPTPAGKGGLLAALQHMHLDELTVNSGYTCCVGVMAACIILPSAASTRLGKLLAAAFKEGIPRTAWMTDTCVPQQLHCVLAIRRNAISPERHAVSKQRSSDTAGSI
jgi:hypothetical protein